MSGYDRHNSRPFPFPSYYNCNFVAVWAETGEFRDSGHSSLTSGGSGVDQSSLYAPPRQRRDRKLTDDSEYLA